MRYYSKPLNDRAVVLELHVGRNNKNIYETLFTITSWGACALKCLKNMNNDD